MNVLPKLHSITKKEVLEVPYLDKILDYGGKYDNSMLYHDILKYGRLLSGNGNFKFTDVAKWLIENNREFRNYYTDSNARIPKSHRVAHKRRRIQGCIDNLVSLGFLQMIGKVKAEKNDLVTSLFKPTLEGNLLSLMLELKFSQNPDDTSPLNMILDMVESLAKDIDSSMLTFVLDFFKTTHRYKTFHSIVMHFINVVIPKSKISNGKELLALFLGLRNCINWILADEKSFLSALGNLDNQHRQAVLFEFKRDIENYYSQNYFIEQWKLSWLHIRSAASAYNIEDDIFYKTVGIPSTYWLAKRIERGNDYENAIIPSICQKCKSDTAFAIKVTKYLELLIGLNQPYPTQFVSGDCMKCGAHFVGAPIMTFPFHTSPWT